MVNFPFHSYNDTMMKKLKAAFSRLSIKKKMYLAIIPAILLLVIAFFAVFRVMFGKLRDNAVKTNYQLLSLMEKDMEKEVDVVRKSNSTLVTNQYVKNYVSSNSTSYDKLALLGKSKELLFSTGSNSFMVVKGPADYVYANLGRSISAYEKQLLAYFVYNSMDRISGPFVLSTEDSSMLYILMSLADEAYIHTDIIVGGVLIACSSKTFISNIAVNYGGRDEIVSAVKTAINSGMSANDITEESLSNLMYTKGQPDPDFIIRPSGEYRLSNYLIWQSAYAEYWFSDVLWPDFRPKHLDEAIEDFSNRNRRFGGL